MDWDGIGTFALFFSTGAVGVGVVVLRAYQAKLAAKLEQVRIEHSASGPDLDVEQMRDLEEKVARLTERVDFQENLLGDGRDRVTREEL